MYGGHAGARNPPHWSLVITQLKVEPSTIGFTDREISPVADLKSLRQSVKSKGIQRPLLVVNTPDGLRLIDGLRRLRVALDLKLTRIPVTCVDTFPEILGELPDPKDPGDCSVPLANRWLDFYYIWQEIKPFALRWQNESQILRMKGKTFKAQGGSPPGRSYAPELAARLGIPGRTGTQWPYHASRMLRFAKQYPNSPMINYLIGRLNAGTITPAGATLHLRNQNINQSVLTPKEEAAVFSSVMSMADGLLHSLKPFGLMGVSDTHDPQLVSQWVEQLRQIRRDITPVIRALEGKYFSGKSSD